ncbi:hypothetical protein N431DRAFT_518537 [Stipitochalara longipes BDJ]|nr:hypothetical protein N431DRAFT_518537 [Stipitochalara longipes BDJ]
MSFYFALPPDESQLLAGFSSFEKNLLSSIVHTLRLGVYLKQRLDGTASELDQEIGGFAAIQPFVKSALSTDFSADKFFPLRLTGASMKEITRIIPLQSGTMTALKIFQLALFRTFAFGDKERIKASTLARDTPPDLDSIAAIITTWGGDVNIALPVYGNFQVIKAKIPIMLALLWEFAETLHNDYSTRATAIHFTEVYQSLAEKKVPSLPYGGVVTWVLVSDFVEYGICAAPTEQDLAEHIMPTSNSSRGSPSGPTGGIKYVAEISGADMPKDAAALAEILHKLMAVFNNPPKKMVAITKLVRDCEEIQGRKINIVDVEHALCKVARQVSKAKIRESKKKKVV